LKFGKKVDKMETKKEIEKLKKAYEKTQKTYSDAYEAYITAAEAKDSAWKAYNEKVDEMNDDYLVTIAIRLSTRQRLKSFGILAHTYNSVINKLLDIAEARTASAEHGNMHADELGGNLYTTWEGREDE